MEVAAARLEGGLARVGPEPEREGERHVRTQQHGGGSHEARVVRVIGVAEGQGEQQQ